VSEAVDLRILGPLEVCLGGHLVALPATKPRVLLASLLVRPNQVIGIDELAERVWGERPPASVKGALQTYVMRLRQTIGTGCQIETTPGGYRLRVEAHQLDVLRFTELARRGRAAREADDLAAAGSAFAEALALWRGPPLADIPSEALQREEVPRLEEQWLRVLEERFDVELAVRRHSEVVAELHQVCCRHPLREHLWAQLMLALYRSGRQAEALEAFGTVSGVLAEQLGIDPGDELRELRQKILLGDPAIAAPSAGGAERAPSVAPSELPPDLVDFVGREQPATDIAALLVAPEHGGPPIVTLTGPPGVGKTALAVHVGHSVRRHFPDGQLYVNLRGYSKDAPLTAPEVLTRFLRALGVPAERIPVEQEEQVALYRSQLGDRRVLVLLDNAASAGQVRTLLPGGAACAVLVTSRDTLRGLAALQGARPVTLDALDERESVRLLRGMIGSAAESEPAATAELANLCTRLPLAMRIAAANVAATPAVSVASYVGRLRSGSRLAALVIDGDEQAAVRAAFDVSYGTLDPAVARAFRLLSVVPGPDFTPSVCAVLCGVPLAEGERLLGVLGTANLLQAHPGSRFQFHDLTREYAAFRGQAEESEDELDVVRGRLLEFAMFNVHQAVRTLIPFHSLLDEAELARNDALKFGEASEASEWLEAERANLLAIVDYCLEHGPWPVVWHIVDAFHRYLATRRYLGDWLRISKAGVQAATYVGDLQAEIVMRISLGLVYMYLGRRQESQDEYLRALAVVRRTPERFRMSAVLINLALVTKEMGDLQRSLEYCKEAVRAAESEDAIYIKNVALGNLGNIHRVLGNLAESIECNQEALRSSQQLGYSYEEAAKLHNLGETHRDIGEPRKAAEYLERSLSLCRALSVESGEMFVLATLADVRSMLGDAASAAELAERSLELARALQDPAGETEALNALGSVNLSAGRVPEAAEDFTRATHTVTGSGALAAEVMALLGLAEAQRLSGELDRAQAHCRTALDKARTAGLRLYEVRAQTCLAALACERGDTVAGGVAARSALEVHQRMDQRLWVARSLCVIGLAHRAAGEEPHALGAFGRMRAILVEADVPAERLWWMHDTSAVP
jgi:DNA-binding SARP family transcriptional activator/tetratricopeptide (TPR) repeat protein